MSEVSSCRERLSRFCVGNGVDIGFGGDPILPTAITLDRCEQSGSRAHVGEHPTNLVWEAFSQLPFRDETLDYVFSSHTLEDAQYTASVLREWMRPLKRGGHLVLFLPDQQTYLQHCLEHMTEPNMAHVHACFSLNYVKDCLFSFGITPSDIIHELFPVPNNDYSFDLVVRKP